MELGLGFRARVKCNYINRGVHVVRVMIRIRELGLGLELGLEFRVRVRF